VTPRERLATARLYLVCPARPRDWIAAAVRGGVDLIQLRDKDLDDDGLIEASAAFRGHDAVFILNDRPDLVEECGADGIHVGQDDAPPAEVRAIVGPEQIIGLSVSHLHEADAAAQNPAPAQPPVNDQPGICARPDSIVVRGVSRVTESAALGDIGLAPRTELNATQLQGALRRLYGTGQYEDVRVACEPSADGQRATLAFIVRERPVLDNVSVSGVKLISEGSVRDKIDVLIGSPLDPSKVARAVQRIDSMYQTKGYYLARIKPESTLTNDGHIRLAFKIDEGRRQVAEITNEQTRIRENLKTVDRSSDYATRLLKKLNDQETSIEKLQTQMDSLQKQLETQRKDFEAYLQNTSVEDKQ